MKFLIYILLCIVCLSSVSAYVFENGGVSINDSNVFIKVEKNVMDRGFNYVNFSTKQFSGDIDFAIGVTGLDAKMISFEVYRNVQVVNQTIPVYENGTIVRYDYTYMTGKKWVNYNLITMSHDFDDKDTWYVGRNIPVITNNVYQARFSLDVRNCPEINCRVDGKYDVAFKPSSETIQQAISNNHFYFIDPYYNSTGGNTMVYDGNYTVVTFTSNGTFVVNGNISNANILTIGGGGGGGDGGGGGAGGYQYNVSYTILNGNYNVTIGSGGLGYKQVVSNSTNSTNGGNSVFNNITAIGGGAGGTNTVSNGFNGGSGGGGAGYLNTIYGLGSQGYNGGTGEGGTYYGSAGGGGAGGSGANGGSAGPKSGGAGGVGLQSSINGTLVYYAGGGGGGSNDFGENSGGGNGGGGNGGANDILSTGGVDGLGGGGGGGANLVNFYNGENGGSGVVIIRYLTYDSNITFKVNLTINLLNETNGASLSTVSVTTLLNDGTTQTSNVSTSGIAFFPNISSNTYTVTVSATGYDTKSYNVIVNSTNNNTLNAYLLQATTNLVVFTIIDDDTGQSLPNANVLIYRWVNNVKVQIADVFSDVTGKIQQEYSDNTRYDYEVSLSGYATKTFTLNPIIYTTYTIRLTPEFSTVDDTDFGSVSVEWSPKQFYNNNSYNISFTFNNPNGNLETYGFNASFNGVSCADSDSTYTGSVLVCELNVTNPAYSIYDYVYITYFYKLDYGDLHTYTLKYTVINAGALTWANNIERDYGMGVFEKTFIGTIIMIILTGAGAMFVGVTGAGLMGLASVYLVVKLGLMTYQLVLVTVFSIAIITAWRMNQ